MPPEQLLSLVSAASFDAVIDASFGALQSAVSCDCVSAFYRSAGDRMLEERDSKGRTYAPEFTALHAKLTPAIPIAMANPGIKLVPTRTGLPQEESKLHCSDFYREVMQVQGWRHAVALCFWDDPPTGFPVLVFSVKRAEGAPDFSDEDLADLETMHAFMDPAVRRIRERATATSMYDALATPLRHDERGVIVLNSRFHLVRCNLAARRLLRRDSSVVTGRRRTRQAQRLNIPAAVIAACKELNDERQQRLRNRTTTNLLRRRLHVQIAKGSALDVFITMISHDSEGMAEPTCVIEIDERIEFEHGARVQSLVSVPGITAAERQVATALAEGLTNQEIADRLGKTVYAVKFLLHQIYRKTGISNRTGLVARLRSRSQARGHVTGSASSSRDD